jgi:hypothetical protein
MYDNSGNQLLYDFAIPQILSARCRLALFVVLQGFHDRVFNVSRWNARAVPVDAVLASPSRTGVDA